MSTTLSRNMKTISEKVFVKTSKPNRSYSIDCMVWSSCIFFVLSLLLGIILVLYYIASQGSIIDSNRNNEMEKDLALNTKSSSDNSGKNLLNASTTDRDYDAQPRLVSQAGKFQI